MNERNPANSELLKNGMNRQCRVADVKTDAVKAAVIFCLIEENPHEQKQSYFQPGTE